MIEQDGRWDAAYAPQSEAEIPLALEEALKKDRQAWAAFQALDKTAKYAVLLPILKATSPERRAMRIQKAMVKLTESA